MTDRAKNERKLTADEKSEFLTRLSELVLDFGVDFNVEEIHHGFMGSTTKLVIEDSSGQELFECSRSFDESDAKYFTGQ